VLLLFALACLPRPAPPPPPVPPPVPPAVEPPAPAVVVPDPGEEARLLPVVEAMAQAYGTYQLEEVRRLATSLVSEAPHSEAAALAQTWLAQLESIGQPAPALEVERWFQGEAPADPVATLYVFFEAWCPHCQAEAPFMQEIHRLYGPRGLAVVGLTQVTRGIPEADVDVFITTHGVAFPVAKERDGSMTAALGIDGIPAIVIVRDGKIAWHGHPALVTAPLLDAVSATPTGQPPP
jgi:thiol-disulfide isomerase/thioredoxin